MSKSADTVLQTARLVLRGPRQGDLDDLFGIYGDPRAMRYWSTVPDVDRDTTQVRLDRHIAAFAERPVYFVIERDGRAIGNIGMVHENEVGFILHPDHWRQGFGREAMGALLPYLWEVTDVPSVFADVHPDNPASLGLLTSLGFVETGRAQNTYCIDGAWSDSVYLALRRPGDA